MTAAAGATGLRSWLQTRGWSWLTPKRLKRATIIAFIAATIVSGVGVSGSSQPTPAHHAAPPAVNH